MKLYRLSIASLLMLTPIILLANLFSCQSSKDTFKDTGIVGGFGKSTKLTSDEKELFEKAVLSHPELKLKPKKVSQQVVAGTNYRFECTDSNKKEVEVVVHQPLPGNGDARILSIGGKDFEAEGFRFIIYYDSDESKQQLLEMATNRGDEVFYQYNNFKAIAIKIISCSSKERALEAYSKQKGVVRMVEDGIMDLH